MHGLLFAQYVDRKQMKKKQRAGAAFLAGIWACTIFWSRRALTSPPSTPAGRAPARSHRLIIPYSPSRIPNPPFSLDKKVVGQLISECPPLTLSSVSPLHKKLLLIRLSFLSSHFVLSRRLDGKSAGSIELS